MMHSAACAPRRDGEPTDWPRRCKQPLHKSPLAARRADALTRLDQSPFARQFAPLRGQPAHA
eukprot:745743-Pleurochrysis_carterae.AAC.1